MKSIKHGTGPINPLVVHLTDNLFEVDFTTDAHFLLGINLFDAESDALVLMDMIVITDNLIAIGQVDKNQAVQAIDLASAKSAVKQTIAAQLQTTNALPILPFLIGTNPHRARQNAVYFSDHVKIAQWLELQIRNNHPGLRHISSEIVETILGAEQQSQFLHNHSQVGKGLQILQTGLAPFVRQEMEAFFGEAWQQQLPGRSGRKSQLDVYLSLKTMLEHWQAIFEKKLGRTQRTFIHELVTIRNQWAHPQADAFSLDDTYRALDTASRLLKVVSVADANMIDQLKNHIMRQQLMRELPQPSIEYDLTAETAVITSDNVDEFTRETNPPSADPAMSTDEQASKPVWWKQIGQFLRKDDTHILPTEITNKILAEMEKNSREAPNYNRYVPNQYTVQINPSNYMHNFEPIAKEICDQWQEEIIEHLELLNRRSGYRKYNLPQYGDLTVRVEAAISLKPAEAVVVSGFAEGKTALDSAESYAYLELIYPQHIKRRWELSPDEITTIGRGNDCHVRLDMPDVLRMSKISGRHAYIIYSRDKYTLYDGEYSGGVSVKPSTNGTYVGGQKVLATPLEARRINQYGRPLQNGDKIVLAPPTAHHTEKYTPGMAVLVFREKS